MKLLDFLGSCRQDLWNGKVKLVRHADVRWDLDLLLRRGLFDEYQSRQAGHVFNCNHIVSFIGEEGARSRFLGVWSVLGVHDDAQQKAYSASFPFPEMGRGTHRYDLVPVEEFGSLQNRLVIDWGASTRAWHQWLSRPGMSAEDGAKANKPVIELRPHGFVREFSGYDDVHLRFDELKRIVENPDANRTWHTMLSGTAGVYLIVDGTNGQQYIGSAYGESGILGRWKGYVASKHGGNKRLKEQLAADPQRYSAFSFSILRTLSRSFTEKEVIAIEGLYKRKLGTRAFGLNEN